MNRTARTTLVGLATSALVLGGVLASSAQAGRGHHQPKPDAFGTGQQVVVDGLDNPRQLALGKRNTIHIAESGRGADDCAAGFCTGATSRISALSNVNGKGAPGLSVVADGMLSGANAGGAYSTGTHGVDVAPDGTVYGVNVAGSGDLTGTLFKVKNGVPQVVADLTAYEFANDPDGQGPQSNPYAVLAQSKRVLVADAASNGVLSVDRKGRISVFADLPNISDAACEGRPNDAGTTGCDFVPTAITEGPGGSIWVAGESAGVAGAGVVWKYDHRGRLLQKWGGFDSPLGLAVEKNGTFYVSEFTAATPTGAGEVTRVKGSTRTSIPVPTPAGLAIIGDELFVATNSIAPSTGLFGNPAVTGQVLRMKR